MMDREAKRLNAELSKHPLPLLDAVAISSALDFHAQHKAEREALLKCAEALRGLAKSVAYVEADKPLGEALAALRALDAARTEAG